MSNSFNNYRLSGVKGWNFDQSKQSCPCSRKKIILLNNFVAQEEKFGKLEK